MKVAFIADPHGNLPALEAVLNEIGNLKIFCCGDLVGYNPFPNEVIEMLRNKKIPCILGNHDFVAAENDTSVFKRIELKEGFNPVAYKAIEWTQKNLKPENLKFLKSLPLFYETKDFYMVHGSPRNPLEEYIFPHHPYMESFLEGIKQNLLVLGHTHQPMIKKFGEKTILNPGSVGQPRDGNPKASFAIYDTKTQEAEIKRVEYDIEKVADKILESGLPQELAMRLFHGR